MFIMILSFCLAFSAPVYATDLTAVGDWTGLIVDPYRQSVYESNPDATVLNVINTAGTKNWRVSVRASYDSNWPADVTLYIRPSAEGRGDSESSPVGVGVYVAVTTSDNIFLESKSDTTGIPIQYKLSGLSLSVPPGSYSTSVSFTVVEI